MLRILKYANLETTLVILKPERPKIFYIFVKGTGMLLKICQPSSEYYLKYKK